MNIRKSFLLLLAGLCMSGPVFAAGIDGLLRSSGDEGGFMALMLALLSPTVVAPVLAGLSHRYKSRVLVWFARFFSLLLAMSGAFLIKNTELFGHLQVALAVGCIGLLISRDTRNAAGKRLLSAKVVVNALYLFSLTDLGYVLPAWVAGGHGDIYAAMRFFSGIILCFLLYRMIRQLGLRGLIHTTFKDIMLLALATGAGSYLLRLLWRYVAEPLLGFALPFGYNRYGRFDEMSLRFLATDFALNVPAWVAAGVVVYFVRKRREV